MIVFLIKEIYKRLRRSSAWDRFSGPLSIGRHGIDGKR